MSELPLRARVERALSRAVLSLPSQVIGRLAGPAVRHEGRVLDPGTQLVLRAMRLTGRRGVEALGVDAARVDLELGCHVVGPAPAPLERVLAVSIDAGSHRLAARLYVPFGVTAPSAAVVFFHGGGFVCGGLWSHELAVRELAVDLRLPVLAVDYRLAPEHRFPAAVDDAVTAFRFAAREAASLGFDPARLGVAGDSAGGNLAAVVSLETRADAVRPKAQLLFYPALDMTLSSPSIDSLARGYMLERSSIEWYLAQYLSPHDDRRDPRASPLFAPDLSGAPPAVVVTAGFDPLRDEGDAYAERLRAARVPVVHRPYPSMIHGFFCMTGALPGARAASLDATRELARLLLVA
jgi:acetyl esterase